MEIIVAGALALLSMPFFCDKKLSRSSRNETNVEDGNLIVSQINNDPPKYDELFPGAQLV